MQGSEETGLGLGRILGELSREGDLWTEFGRSDEELSKWKRYGRASLVRDQQMKKEGRGAHAWQARPRLRVPAELCYIPDQAPHSHWLHICILHSIMSTQTEAMSHLFLYSQHLAYARNIARIFHEYWSNETGFKSRFGPSMGSLPTSASPQRTGQEGGKQITTATLSLLWKRKCVFYCWCKSNPLKNRAWKLFLQMWMLQMCSHSSKSHSFNKCFLTNE